jgi:hypothetical protein
MSKLQPADYNMRLRREKRGQENTKGRRSGDQEIRRSSFYFMIIATSSVFF